jgi:hypothetical protein
MTITRHNMAGSWAGFAYGDLYYYRFCLRADGTGEFAVCYLSRDVTLFDILNWELKQGKVAVHFKPITHPSGIRNIRGEVWGEKLKLAISGGDWEHSLILHNENTWVRSSQLVQQVMSHCEK